MRPLRTLSAIELRLFLREPMTVVFTLALPVVILYVLGGVFGNEPSTTRSGESLWRGVGPMDYYVPAYIGMVLASIGLIGLPVHLASYRERGVLRRFRASGLPAAAVLASQLVKSAVIAVVGSALVVISARLSYDTAMPEQLGGAAVAFTLSLLAFVAIGLLLGALMPTARAAQGIGVLLWFVMLIVAGAGPPRERLTDGMRTLGDVTPLGRVVPALQDPWLGFGWNAVELAIITAIAVIAGGIALWSLERQAR